MSEGERGRYLVSFPASKAARAAMAAAFKAGASIPEAQIAADAAYAAVMASGVPVVGRVTHDGRRFLLWHADGRLSNRFGAWETREDVRNACTAAGLVLHGDNTVTRA
jgi:hypothetical protein